MSVTRYITETHIDATHGYIIGESRLPVEESIFFDGDVTAGDLYRFGVQEFGRCARKVYVDKANGETVHCGYVFQRRRPYEDAHDQSYLHEVWVAVEDVRHRPDVVTAVAL